MSQLALPLQLADHAVFDSYYRAGNDTVVDLLCSLADGEDGQGCWLAGAPATGKTHLLQAVCERAGDRAVYVPLSVLADAGPGPLEGLASREIICLDDIDAVVDTEDWERALFALCNEVVDANRCLIVSAGMSPREIPIRLPDLQSRLLQLPVFRIEPLGESDRIAALQLRARHRGLDLPDDTARFLLSRSRRDMASLYALLDKLDVEALRAQRRLTIPFVKQVLE